MIEQYLEEEKGSHFYQISVLLKYQFFVLKKKTAHIIQSCFSVYQIVAELVVQETKDDD